jgi:hypothetical protein
VDILRDGIVKTRKDHKCHGCLCIIPKGSEVYSQTNTSDSIFTLYMCDDCINFCKKHKCNECMQMEEAYVGYVKECNRAINNM